MTTPYCPVCRVPMWPSEMAYQNNTTLFLCQTSRRVVLPEFSHQEWVYWDSAIQVGADDSWWWQMYEFPPYRIQVYNNPKRRGTIIEKGQSDVHRINYKLILELSEPLALPWHDRELVLKKIKTVLVFS